MKRKLFIFVLFFCVSLASYIVINDSIKRPEDIFTTISRSHIQGNVPDEAEFDQILRQALIEFFSEAEKMPVNVEYELLRKVPTQTGVATPKFYLWVKIMAQDKIIRQGAVRAAAVEKKEFDILQFVDVAQIKADPDIIRSIFPAPVAEKILAILTE